MTEKSKETGRFQTTIGGQALIEGIMMRGPGKYSVVIRTPDGGVVSDVKEVKLIKERYPVLGLPFIRGAVNFFDSLVTGVKALLYSADFFPEEEEASKFDMWVEKHFSKKTADGIMMGIAVALGMLLPIGLFILLPTFLAGFFEGIAGSGFVRNLIEGGIRILLFVLYLVLVSRLNEMKRVFSYHGAEHKTIYCYEAGEELTVENVRTKPREHPRCGTSFLFVVMIVSILLFSFVSWSNPLIRAALRLLLLPVVVAISYEFNRIVGRYNNSLSRALRKPGMLMQKLTTNEPDDSMIEVAIEALRLVIPEEEGSDRW
ncbi:MAG: DUF1385 domain-containing protein [Oscillospiraceae bacterium]|jgi:uncharacterized protein YqhQ|nr:DUF1385 domain-containing protein [Oscillospiraceae bacterium]